MCTYLAILNATDTVKEHVIKLKLIMKLCCVFNGKSTKIVNSHFILLVIVLVNVLVLKKIKPKFFKILSYKYKRIFSRNSPRRPNSSPKKH